MRKCIYMLLLGISIKGFAQTDAVNLPQNIQQDLYKGSVAGYITTADKKPAAYVTVILQSTNKFTQTDENGYFIIKNIKEGNYTISVSITGLKPIEKNIIIKKDQETTLNILLDEDAKQLQEVIITTIKTQNDKPVLIGKIAINPMDLPQSIASIGQVTIKEQQANRLGDIIKNVNGVYLTTTRGGVQESFAARGYAFSSTNLFKDGFRVNAGVMPEVSSLERVEVLKGSSAILYGQVAPGGILNMVTKQPGFDNGGEISFRAGSYDDYKSSFDVYGPATKKIAYRINASFQSENSFRDNVSSKRYYINPSLLFKINKRSELLLQGDYLKHSFTPDFGIGTVDNTKIPDLTRSTFLGAVWAYNKTQQYTTTATYKYQINSNWNFSTAATYQLYKRDYYSTERIQAAANGDWVRPLGKIDATENFYGAQANLTGKIKTGNVYHTILTGADADKSFTTNYDFSFPAVTGLAAGSYDKINIYDAQKFVARTDMPAATTIRQRQAPVNRGGIYIQDLIKLSQKINLLAGLRWSYVQTVAIDSTNLLTGIKTKGITRNDNALSPRFGLVYKPTTSTSLFASYANSFTVNTGTDIYGKALPPSVIDQYELGIKNDFFKGKLSVNVTAYKIINNNLAQTAQFDVNGNQNSNTSIKILSGQVTSDGVEFDITGHPVEGLSIMSGYSYNYTRYTKTDSAKGNFIEGERLLNNPANAANASIFYTFGKGILKRFKLGAVVVYTGNRVGGFSNTIGQTQTYSRTIPVKGYTVVDVSAGYNFKKISVMAKVSNIANTLNYYVHENYSINPIAPRMAAMTVTYKF